MSLSKLFLSYEKLSSIFFLTFLYYLTCLFDELSLSCSWFEDPIK